MSSDRYLHQPEPEQPRDVAPPAPCHGTWWCQATEHVEGCFATDPSAAERRRVYASRRTTSLNEIAEAAMRIAPDAFLPLTQAAYKLRYAIAERALQLVEAWVAEGEEDQ